MDLQERLKGMSNFDRIARVAGVSAQSVFNAAEGKAKPETVEWITGALDLIEKDPTRGLTERQIAHLQRVSDPLQTHTPRVVVGMSQAMQERRVLFAVRPMVKRFLQDGSQGNIDQWRLLTKIVRESRRPMSPLLAEVTPLVRRWNDDGYKGTTLAWERLARMVRAIELKGQH